MLTENTLLRPEYDPAGWREIPFTPAEIHAKTLAGDFSGLRVYDFKTMTLTTGEVLEMQIAAINPYKNHGDTALGNHIIWISRDCLAQTYQMRPNNTNNGTVNEKNPFRASALFSTLQNTIYPTLPEDWRGIIGNMRCLSGDRYSSSGTVNSDTGWSWKDRGNLFLPTQQEAFGNNGFSEHLENGGGGLNIQWPIFVGGNVIKGLGRGGPRYGWWLCSANSTSSIAFCYVTSEGTSTSVSASESLGVPLCFITI